MNTEPLSIIKSHEFFRKIEEESLQMGGIGHDKV